jgi:hypothetical protein
VHNRGQPTFHQEYEMTARSDRRVQVLLTEDEAARFERYCHDHGHKKSTLLVRLLREFLDREGYPNQKSLFTQAGTPNDTDKSAARN